MDDNKMNPVTSTPTESTCHRHCAPLIRRLTGHGVWLSVLLLHLDAASACTSGCAAGPATADGRPILWYNNDQASDILLTPHITKHSGSPYDYIVVQTQDYRQGTLNANGLAKGANNMHSFGRFENTVGLRITQVADVAAVRRGLDTWSYSDSTFVAVIDRYANGCGFEIGTNYWEYPATSTSRQTQPEGFFGGDKAFVVRANAAFKNRDHREPAAAVSAWPSSPYGIDSRYTSARDLFIQYIDDADKLTVDDAMAISRDGEPGITSFARVCHPNTAFGQIVLGVKAGDHPRFATMLAALGIPDYSIFIPVWCDLTASELSGYVDAYDDTSIGYYTYKIMQDHFDHTPGYDDYIQSLFRPVEANIIEAVQAARTNWLELKNTSRFHAEAVSMHTFAADAAYHTIKSAHATAGAGGRGCNLPPNISSLGASVDGLTVHFVCNARDKDGISYWCWQFGDGATVNSGTKDLSRTSHTYETPGTYLVMCYVKDNQNDPAANVRWEYVTIPGPDPHP